MILSSIGVVFIVMALLLLVKILFFTKSTLVQLSIQLGAVLVLVMFAIFFALMEIIVLMG